MTPPRRLGRSLKLALRAAIGLAIDLSCMKSRSSVLRAASRVMVFLMVTLTVPPGFVLALAIESPNLRVGKYSERPRRGKSHLGRLGDRFVQRRPFHRHTSRLTDDALQVS